MSGKTTYLIVAVEGDNMNVVVDAINNCEVPYHRQARPLEVLRFQTYENDHIAQVGDPVLYIP